LTFVDTNVLLDVARGDASWAAWSNARLDERAACGPLVINDVVYAEVSVTFDRIEAVNAFLEGAGFKLERTPRPALFLAARAHLRYRRRGGTRRGVLPDFLIGAHAALRDVPLLTRDPRRYRDHFPTLRVIAPDPLPPGSGPH
jgi:predicted nucleic acid-binding protein